MELTLKEWLNLEPLEEEVNGNPHEGYWIDLDKLREKIRYMEVTFKVFVNYSNFRHTMFNTTDKRILSSGTIDVEIISNEGFFSGERYFEKRLTGGSTFNVDEYPDTSYYANISKTLSIRNALLEFPQFGANLNKQEIKRTVVGKKFLHKTSDKLNDAIKTVTG